MNQNNFTPNQMNSYLKKLYSNFHSPKLDYRFHSGFAFSVTCCFLFSLFSAKFTIS